MQTLADFEELKRKARLATTKAIKRGIITQKPCEVCGSVASQAHHDDYSKPLEVRWLCSKHHAHWHRDNVPAIPAELTDDQANAAIIASRRRFDAIALGRTYRKSMKDIAEIVGVSTMTVSRALGGKPNISDETRRQIEAVAREIGYKNECEHCGKTPYTIAIHKEGQPRRTFCDEKCMVAFYSNERTRS